MWIEGRKRVHINLGILSTDVSVVEEGLGEVKDCFESRNLRLHPGEVRSGSVSPLDCELRGDSMAARITNERFGILRQAITSILKRMKVSGRLLEVPAEYYFSIFNTRNRYMHAT